MTIQGPLTPTPHSRRPLCDSNARDVGCNHAPVLSAKRSIQLVGREGFEPPKTEAVTFTACAL